MTTQKRSPKYVIVIARKLRVNLTPAEKILWELLKNKKLDGFKFRNQHPIYRYIIDFYCHEKRLAIEIDGNVHELRQQYDAFRDKFLESIEISTLRFNNEDVFNNITYVISEIKKALNR